MHNPPPPQTARPSTSSGPLSSRAYAPPLPADDAGHAGQPRHVENEQWSLLDQNWWGRPFGIWSDGSDCCVADRREGQLSPGGERSQPRRGIARHAASRYGGADDDGVRRRLW